MTTTGSNIHPPFCLRDYDDNQRVSDYIEGWSVEQVSELEDYAGMRGLWYISTARDSLPNVMDADEVFGLVLEARALKANREQSALEKKVKQYQKLKEELGL